MYDVIVCGAGPVGSSAARFCAEKGMKTLLIEEHAQIGRPVQCAGLLSVSAFKECRTSRRCILNEVTGAKVISHTGRELFIDTNETKAYVVDRSALDFEMGVNAAESGSDIIVKRSVIGYECTETCGRVKTTGIGGEKTFEGRVIIAADGPRSVFSRYLNLRRAQVMLSGVQADLAVERSSDIVELHPYASPEFFGWVIPVSEKVCRVGLCGTSDIPARFKKFTDKLTGEASGVSNLHLVTGTIPLGVMEKTYSHRVMFCGDAGGFAKPTSGGGIYTGIRTAHHAAETAAECCGRGIFDDNALAAYEKRWKADLGRDLSCGLTAYKIRQNISDELMDKLIECMNTPKIKSEILNTADMDRPGKIITKLLAKPCILKSIAGIAASELKSIL